MVNPAPSSGHTPTGEPRPVAVCASHSPPCPSSSPVGPVWRTYTSARVVSRTTETIQSCAGIFGLLVHARYTQLVGRSVLGGACTPSFHRAFLGQHLGLV
ncbi:Piso0_005254 [Millerozyma farinosa CBS 7064]|uniref:Piso0_005254 protein n=1 Tax=Pichia sorbitophila (strain ATCC MYA-4447 / BCRC 22081 / CBS 7064 / NBRC 10061 / NRRL Y-12695) TaxID=559304 RepID=G8Y4L8_PICSO|nr:Piso0_005254 [Millerozyma farinosa CBS 7064]